MFGWKDLREIIRASSGIVLARTIFLSRGDRIQLDSDLFVRQLSNPFSPKGTILMMRGGAFHMGNEDFYIKVSCALLPDHRVYFLEKLKPMVNFELSEDIPKILGYLRKIHPEPLIVMGFSMGGILTWNYLGKGRDQADLYVPVSAPINMVNFNRDLHKHFIYEKMYQKVLRDFNVTDDESLMRASGLTLADRDLSIENFLPSLKRSQPNWQDKTFPVSGTEDTLLESYSEDLKEFPTEVNAVIVPGGTHCCLTVIWHACLVIRTYTTTRLTGSDLLQAIREQSVHMISK